MVIRAVLLPVRLAVGLTRLGVRTGYAAGRLSVGTSYRVGRRVYATQFHPEVSAEDFMSRAVVYRHHGYFPADELDAFNARVAAASVTEPRRMLRRFVELADAEA